MSKAAFSLELASSVHLVIPPAAEVSAPRAKGSQINARKSRCKKVPPSTHTMISDVAKLIARFRPRLMLQGWDKILTGKSTWSRTRVKISRVPSVDPESTMITSLGGVDWFSMLSKNSTIDNASFFTVDIIEAR